jgi:uncharacterized protein involved in type VI secretion and phage assembly
MSLEQIVADLAEQVERRHFGKYRGLVVDNADPEQLGRLRLQVPSLLGPDVVTGWALPCAPYGGDAGQGFLFIPEVGAGVWVEFEEGDLEFPIWSGTFWSKPGGDSELPRPDDTSGNPASAPQDPPTRKILKTLRAHSIQFEDSSDDKKALIIIREGVHHHMLTLDANGITIADGVNGHTVVLDSNGIALTDGVNGHSIVMSATAFTITAKKAFTINAAGQAIVIKGDSIDLNKA